MATKCPYCGSKNVKGINKIRQFTAGVVGSITTFGAMLINPNKGPAIQLGRKMSNKICSNRKYKCMNPSCNKHFNDN